MRHSLLLDIHELVIVGAGHGLTWYVGPSRVRRRSPRRTWCAHGMRWEHRGVRIYRVWDTGRPFSWLVCKTYLRGHLGPYKPLHPCRGLGSTSPADILLNSHVMPSPARKWIIKSRPQKLVPEAHWTSWLPLRAVNRDKWGPWLWGTLRLPGYGAPRETGPVLCPRCGQHHGLAVQECLLSCPSESRFWDIWTDTRETWKPEATCGDKRRPQTNCACAPVCISDTPFNDPSFQSKRTGGW